ncbi:TAFII55 protein conserved region-domain-containing protein [Fomitopsis serialis]|uniref:TAFII55 protein conserved region-domain-containing protein n=1 Tax=Fomitopsis serialis TaxID=139415 RepID=UPI002007AC7C|nr:TAFII55 protein conserved region-domain-containing protein [Neoantrodia serialis]KAH9934714.1 TAFII55 protein conserved region-domain-containing protein [Neoantrodia serialis]
MEDDLIVVDDVDDQDQDQDDSGPSREADQDYRPTRAAAAAALRATRAASKRSTPPVYTMDYSEGRTTRSALNRNKPAPKLKLKLGEKAAAHAPGMSFLGSYDRELDSDDEELVFEEQFILRMPPGDDCDRLRKMVAAREISNDVWFKFKDSRRAVFHIGNKTWAAKLVDMPCIVESQKTLDNKQMFKVADICQMLVVDKPIDNEDSLTNQKNFNVDEFIWPHGLTPPLHYARKRRFRKRVNKRTIETVEQEVERLLEEDALADQVKYDVLENVNPDLSDSEYIELEKEDPMGATMPGFLGSDAGDAPTPGHDHGEGDEEDEGNEGEGEGDIDEELAAELDLALGDEEEVDDEEGDDEEEESDEDDDEDEDEDDEMSQAKKLLNEEIRDLEAAVAKKGSEISSSANPLIKRRFEDALKKLQADLDMKLAQRDELKEKQRLRKEGIMPEEGDTDGVNEGDAEDEEEEDDLFGDEPGAAMDVD